MDTLAAKTFETGILALKRYLRLRSEVAKNGSRLIQAHRVHADGLIRLAAGKRRLAAKLPKKLPPKSSIEVPLSPRLRQTRDYLLQGMSEKQVAAKLNLSRHTIHLYVTAIYRAYDVHSRGELLVKCLNADLKS